MKEPKRQAESQRPKLDVARMQPDLPLGDAVFRVLRRALQDGVWRPGDRLREEEVARELNVSRTPVREALGRLQSKRLIEPGGAKGLVVRALDLGEILELYAMREILEGAAASLAAQHASSSEIDSLADINAAFRKPEIDAAEMARLNRLFHDTIVRAARNRYLQIALEELQDGIALLGDTTFSIAGRGATAHDEHHAILAAIAARKAEAAGEAARTHIREALRQRLKLSQGVELAR
ncbi:MAG TPA: GntR family transcriptional regulator [Stellaceae bacterium]|nr:GntR family transcriptional regulator [Stellaceae bacterium]